MEPHTPTRDAASHEQHDRWLLLIQSARWFRVAPTCADTLRCGVCRLFFTPSANGAATFIEERGAILLRVCSRCEPLFASAARDRRQSPGSP